MHGWNLACLGGFEEIGLLRLFAEVKYPWISLNVVSSRVNFFSEEVYFFRFAHVTGEGVVIKGTDPLMGSWLGKLLEVECLSFSDQASSDVIALLTSNNSLLLFDVHHHRQAEVFFNDQSSQALEFLNSEHLKGKKMWQGGDGRLMIMDIENLSLYTVFVNEHGIRLEAHFLVLPSGPFGDALQSNQLICAGQSDAETILLKHCDNSNFYMLRFGSDSGLWLKHFAVDCAPYKVQRVSSPLTSDQSQLVTKCFAASQNENVAVTEEFQIADGLVTVRHLESSNGFPQMQSLALLDESFPEANVLSSSGYFTLFVQQMTPSEDAEINLMGVSRTETADLNFFLKKLESELGYVFPEHESSDSSFTLIKRSLYHRNTGTAVNAFSLIKDDNMLAVVTGHVLVELIDNPANRANCRHVWLSSKPGYTHLPWEVSSNLRHDLAHQSGTGGSLSAGGIKLVKEGYSSSAVANDPDRKVQPRRHGLAACVGISETALGWLVLVFADGHIRLLDVDEEKLEREKHSWLAMSGKVELEEQRTLNATRSKATTTSRRSTERAINMSGFASLNQPQDGDMEGNGNANDRGDGAGQSGSGKRTSSRSIEAKQMQEEVERILKEGKHAAEEVGTLEDQKIELTAQDEEYYSELFAMVEGEISQLRSILMNVEAREKERVWLRNKVSGEIDENKIADLAIGEKNVFKKRGRLEHARIVQSRPKKLVFLVDCSASMAYFNGDARLDRLCASMVLVMEALVGLEHKYNYEIVGHSGETRSLRLVSGKNKTPKNRKERLEIIKRMIEHSRSCQSGDTTLQATVAALDAIDNEPADDYFLFLFSDANLEGYGVDPGVLAKLLSSKSPKVNAFALFIAEKKNAERLRQQMPTGKAHVIMDTSQMPLILKDIFARVMTQQSKL